MGIVRDGTQMEFEEPFKNSAIDASASGIALIIPPTISNFAVEMLDW